VQSGGVYLGVADATKGGEMRLPFRVSTIKWLPYPENKPEVAIDVFNSAVYYLCFLNNGRVEILSSFYSREQLSYPSQPDPDSQAFYYSNGAQCDRVLMFAELPTLDDSDEFDFATALELMKAGVECESLVDGKVIFIDEGVFKTNDHNNTFPIQLWSDQILGKWRQA
jgi:hypothetical protein